jgi:hypothetical protein
VQTPKSYTLTGYAYNLADGLILHVKANLTPGDSIIVATFADVTGLEKSCPFGRILADEVGLTVHTKRI